MIVSHAHRFIFIKTQKTAGTAMEVALSKFCGPDDIITPIQTWIEGERAEQSGRGPQNYRFSHPLVPKRPLIKRLMGRPERHYHPSIGFYDHMPAWRVKAYVGDEVWGSYFKFAFERNPWDRQVSWYHYKTKSKPDGLVPTFEAFLADEKRAKVDNHALYAIDGTVAVDFLGRYEAIETDFAQALAQAGLPDDVALPKVNVRRARTLGDAGGGGPSATDLEPADEPAYRRHYTDAARTKVTGWYRAEIDLLGYTF